MSESNRDSIVIDPRAMNVVNRIAEGSRQAGNYRCVGGLLVQGRIEGDVEVIGGPLILMQGGELAGSIKCDGEAYLFGTIMKREDGQLSDLDAHGTVFMAETLVAEANVTAGAFKTYQGFQVTGRISSIRRDTAAA